jgi:hypothetical protein
VDICVAEPTQEMNNSTRFEFSSSVLGARKARLFIGLLDQLELGKVKAATAAYTPGNG